MSRRSDGIEAAGMLILSVVLIVFAVSCREIRNDDVREQIRDCRARNGIPQITRDHGFLHLETCITFRSAP